METRLKNIRMKGSWRGEGGGRSSLVFAFTCRHTDNTHTHTNTHAASHSRMSTYHNTAYLSLLIQADICNETYTCTVSILQHAASLTSNTHTHTVCLYTCKDSHNWMMSLHWHAAHQGWHVLLTHTLTHIHTLKFQTVPSPLGSLQANLCAKIKPL